MLIEPGLEGDKEACHDSRREVPERFRFVVMGPRWVERVSSGEPSRDGFGVHNFTWGYPWAADVHRACTWWIYEV